MKVGAIIVKDGNIISFGFNGTPAGECNTCEIDGETKDNVIHAEVNTILKCKQPLEGAELYVTHSPCENCASLIKSVGIKKVYFTHLYRINEHLKYLNCEQITI